MISISAAQAFRVMDLDGDGTVTLAEMRRYMCEKGQMPLSEEEFKESGGRRHAAVSEVSST